MRPEQVIVAAAAARFCGQQDIPTSEVKHIRATAIPVWTGETPEESGWAVFVAPYKSRYLRLLCSGDEFEIVDDVRLIDDEDQAV